MLRLNKSTLNVQIVCKTLDNGVYAAESSSSDTPAGVKKKKDKKEKKNPLI